MNKPKIQPMSASVIVKLLASKHSDDIFVNECKDGPTWADSHLRLDGWAMAKSWKNPCMTGYEIKVARSDFLGDNKWRGYLDLCNCFYFVAPKGLIQIDELSPEAGLMECVGSRLVTRKKAAYREIAMPESLLLYVLMCRCKIVSPNRFQDGDQAAFWRAWLDKKEEDKELGYHVSRKVRQYVDKVERENGDLKKKHREYDDIRSFLESLGYNKDSSPYSWSVKQKYEDVMAKVPPTLLRDLKETIRACKNLEQELEQMGKPQGEIPMLASTNQSA